MYVLCMRIMRSLSVQKSQLALPRIAPRTQDLAYPQFRLRASKMPYCQRKHPETTRCRFATSFCFPLNYNFFNIHVSSKAAAAIIPHTVSELGRPGSLHTFISKVSLSLCAYKEHLRNSVPFLVASRFSWNAGPRRPST